MAAVETNRSVQQVSHGVQTHETLLDGAKGDVHRVGDGKFRVHVLEVPLKGFALQTLPQFHSGLDAAEIANRNQYI